MKVVIENTLLRGSERDFILQRVAVVHSPIGDEYGVYAPATAKGNALEWIDYLLVHQLSESREGENDVTDGRKASIINQVK
jgi:hypothetical protein